MYYMLIDDQVKHVYKFVSWGLTHGSTAYVGPCRVRPNSTVWTSCGWCGWLNCIRNVDSETLQDRDIKKWTQRAKLSVRRRRRMRKKKCDTKYYLQRSRDGWKATVCWRKFWDQGVTELDEATTRKRIRRERIKLLN